MDKIKLKDAVAETLLIPLYMRAKESKREKNKIINDPWAIELTDKVEYDYSKFDGAKLSAVGCVVRCWCLDNVVRRFCSSHVNPVIVNVACGLDARYQRTIEANSQIPFYSLDLPEVITLRKRLLPEADMETYIASSLFETKWMDELNKKHPNGSFLFIMEGVLMYFHKKDIKKLFANLSARFPECEIWFDACGSISVKHQDKHDSVKKVSARFNWAINDGHDIEKWDKRFHLIDQSSQGLFFRSRYPFPMNVMGIFPKLLYKFCSIIGIKIN